MNLHTFHPAYAFHRIAQMRYQSANRWAPWLTATAVTALQDLLKPSDIGFEFGSGRSTLWLARRVQFLHSMEHEPEWFARVHEWLEREKLTDKVDYQLTPASGELAYVLSDDHPYVKGITEMPDGELDFVLVDGILRLTCVRLSMRKLKPGGVLILDNADRFVPNKYQEGYTTIGKLRQRDAPRDAEWGQTCAELATWRGFNATDRVNDTRFWFKPAA